MDWNPVMQTDLKKRASIKPKPKTLIYRQEGSFLLAGSYTKKPCFVQLFKNPAKFNSDPLCAAVAGSFMANGWF